MLVDSLMAMIFHLRGFTYSEMLDNIYKYSSMLWWLFKLPWFIIGNVWVYTDTTCSASNSYIENENLWNFSLAILILNYFGVAFMFCIYLWYRSCKHS